MGDGVDEVAAAALGGGIVGGGRGIGVAGD